MGYIDFGSERVRARLNISNGQLISLALDNKEFFHDGGSPHWQGNGWGNSEIIMFPLVGLPIDYAVIIGGMVFPQDQHGISRILPFDLAGYNASSTKLIQDYEPHDMRNPKHKPGNDHPEYVFWPFAYTIQKEFEVKDDLLIMRLTITNKSDNEMPYMCGWHPGFNLQGIVADGEFSIDGGKRLVTLDEVIAASLDSSKSAYKLENVRSVSYHDRKSRRGVIVSSDDFKHMMIWSPGNETGMFCIEPVTHFPIHSKDELLFMRGSFECLKPGEQKTYSVTLRPFAHESIKRFQ